MSTRKSKKQTVRLRTVISDQISSKCLLKRAHVYVNPLSEVKEENEEFQEQITENSSAIDMNGSGKRSLRKSVRKSILSPVSNSNSRGTKQSLKREPTTPSGNSIPRRSLRKRESVSLYESSDSEDKCRGQKRRPSMHKSVRKSAMLDRDQGNPSTKVTPRRRISSDCRSPNSESTPISVRSSTASSRISVNSTPKRSIPSRELIPQTPMTVQKRRKEVLESRVVKSKYKETDDCSSESEFDSKSECESSSDEYELKMPRIKSNTSKEKLNTSVRRKIFDECDYTVNADRHFQCKTGGTSNNTLRKFQNFNMEQNELKKVLKSDYVQHVIGLENLNVFYESQFKKWLFYLSEGYNLIMYGLGSKIQVIEHFASTVLSDCYIVKAKGFFSKFVVKDIIKSIINEMFGVNGCPANTNEALNLIASLLKNNDFPIFVIVYNLDGVALRNSKHQSVLSKLAALPNLYLIATIDHVNAPLLWGNKILSQFNFVWLNVTTYEPYIFETCDKDALQMRSSSDEGLNSLLKIYNGCSDKMKKIFRLIAEDNLNSKLHKYKGIRFHDLYSKAKRELLVNEPRLLNTMLKDFYEHEIIKKTCDDYLVINMNRVSLSTFYEEQYNEDG